MAKANLYFSEPSLQCSLHIGFFPGGEGVSLFFVELTFQKKKAEVFLDGLVGSKDT